MRAQREFATETQRHRDSERTLQIPTRRRSAGAAGRHAPCEPRAERKPWHSVACVPVAVRTALPPQAACDAVCLCVSVSLWYILSVFSVYALSGPPR
jgi:hypothetical protein